MDIQKTTVSTLDELNQVAEASKSIGPIPCDLILNREIVEYLGAEERNPMNRRIDRGLVSRLVSDISNGRWVYNGETIILTSDLLVNDGQHRLLAASKSGATIITAAIIGAARDSRTTVDTGRSRTLSNFLAMEGAPNSSVASTVVKYLASYERLGGKSINVDIITTPEGKQYYRENSAEIDSIISKTPSDTSKVGGRSFVAAARCIIERECFDDEVVNDFFVKYIKGTLLPEESPIYKAREYIMEAKKRKLSVLDKFEIILRAWNAFYRGKTWQRMITLSGTLPLRIQG